ncbi:MAG: hypothetical protein KME16_14780 [Scytolyngbya sp. HA4215-MV1]|nr:hypothetical protein [Scytolyngbya sp. HA4215-MV1]
MPLVTFLLAIFSSLVLVKVFIELPLSSLHWLNISNWLGATIVLLLLSWCVGD